MMRNHQITLAVPNANDATRWLTRILGHAGVDSNSVLFEPGVELTLVSSASTDSAPPSIVDLGTNHLCFRVNNIERVADQIGELPHTEVLGDVIEVPEGPIQGNKWVYFRSPWGTLFELQEWPKTPQYFRETDARLFHDHPAQRPEALHGIRGLDHTGYSVDNLESAISNLTNQAGGRIVLRTEMTVDETFTRRQFGIDIRCTSKMAMIAVDGLNIELFEHRGPEQQPPRRGTEFGGHKLLLSSSLTCAPDLSSVTRVGVS
ncbi:hypothetical protein [Cryobacterium sp. M15]|jgi:catechol 2,3-dioxygenase-like lactoylglutathione lyase family enzyme|uniref:hypothetical protein n=1 Tax=Cryobacterium sp. M15 TaxID=2048291 RepID=UPI000CE45FFA|nr:hypothetical protein [Cryobacterium sp. M15]